MGWGFGLQLAKQFMEDEDDDSSSEVPQMPMTSKANGTGSKLARADKGRAT